MCGIVGVVSKNPVNQLIYDGLPVSLAIGFYAMFISILCGLFFGSFAALKQNSKIDYLMNVFALIGISIPGFVTAPLMILFFSLFLC